MAKSKTHHASTEPDFFELLRAGTRALQLGKAEQARKLLERAHKLNPDDYHVTLNLAGACILSKKFGPAINLLEPLSQREPTDPMVWTNLGAAYLGNPVLAKDAEHQRAIAAFQKAYELNPQAPNVAYNLGLIYLDRQETGEALLWFKRAIAANPADKDAQNYVTQLSRSVV